MVSKARHNRPKKKEIPQDKWDETIRSLQDRYQYGGKHHGENTDPEKE